jgi:hypothetical protein
MLLTSDPSHYDSPHAIRMRICVRPSRLNSSSGRAGLDPASTHRPADAPAFQRLNIAAFSAGPRHSRRRADHQDANHVGEGEHAAPIHRTPIPTPQLRDLDCIGPAGRSTTGASGARRRVPVSVASSARRPAARPSPKGSCAAPRASLDRLWHGPVGTNSSTSRLDRYSRRQRSSVPSRRGDPRRRLT